MKLGGPTIDFQMMVKWSWSQKSLAEDEGGQERRRKGPGIQGRVIGSSNVTIVIRKVI